MKVVQARKTVIQQEKIEFKKANMMKHELQKVVKEIALAEQKKLRQKQLFLGRWILNIFLCNLGASLKEVLRSQKISFAKQVRMTAILTRFQKHTQMLMKNKADTVQDRLRLEIRL